MYFAQFRCELCQFAISDENSCGPWNIALSASAIDAEGVNLGSHTNLIGLNQFPVKQQFAALAQMGVLGSG